MIAYHINLDNGNISFLLLSSLSTTPQHVEICARRDYDVNRFIKLKRTLVDTGHNSRSIPRRPRKSPVYIIL